MAVPPPQQRHRRRCRPKQTPRSRRQGEGKGGGGGGGGARRDAAAPRLPPDALPGRLQVIRPPAPRQPSSPPISIPLPRPSAPTRPFSIPDGDVLLCVAGASAEAAAAAELTDWQQRHAVLVLAKAKELAKIRYDLCPRHMKDKQFWRVYFLLAKSYILPYELRAIQKEKVRRMEAENRKSKDVITVEVEMQESKCSRESQMLPVDSEFQDS
ncbi:hypothetical protein BRADI_5g24967v3 [Brachypodium distachyon]|uniref:BSD domain-containing protein n=1 Tax=Brachypodium distachyon TaxID=15368 RepID=A0A2K2CJ66_BRADI|nr:hypothetical protein BRADI_5g24967v3 [Brachypodium distachyon]